MFASARSSTACIAGSSPWRTRERANAGEEADEVVLAAQREHGVDEVVADPGLALLDLEAVGEEIEECLPTIAKPFNKGFDLGAG